MIADPELPILRSETVLQLLVQTPTVVFPYFDLSEIYWKTVLQRGGLMLRLFEVRDLSLSPTQCLVTEVEILPFNTNWYFHDLAAGRYYISELGFHDSSISTSFLRSGIVFTPHIGWATDKVKDRVLAPVTSMGQLSHKEGNNHGNVKLTWPTSYF